jgi:hypothetical protein
MRQLTVVNDAGSIPPVPACALYSDLITADQSLCSLSLVAGTVQSVDLVTEIEAQSLNVTGIHKFTLSFGPGISDDWSTISTTICLTMTFV